MLQKLALASLSVVNVALCFHTRAKRLAPRRWAGIKSVSCHHSLWCCYANITVRWGVSRPWVVLATRDRGPQKNRSRLITTRTVLNSCNDNSKNSFLSLSIIHPSLFFFVSLPLSLLKCRARFLRTYCCCGLWPNFQPVKMTDGLKFFPSTLKKIRQWWKIVG